MPSAPLLNLTARPYRSGTADDPLQAAANVTRLEAAARPLSAAGLVPMISEQLMCPTRERLLGHGDAGPLLPVQPRSDDRDAEIVRQRPTVHFSVEDSTPVAEAA